MKYIKVSLGVKLPLRADRLSVIKWWADASFSTHNNFRGNNGGMVSMGAGTIKSGSWKQSINGRSSMDNNIIGVNDIMGPVL